MVSGSRKSVQVVQTLWLKKRLYISFNVRLPLGSLLLESLSDH